MADSKVDPAVVLMTNIGITSLVVGTLIYGIFVAIEPHWSQTLGAPVFVVVTLALVIPLLLATSSTWARKL